jgi:hypothetical protein
MARVDVIRRTRDALGGRIALVAVAAVAVAAVALFAVPKLTGGSGSASDALASVKLAPEPWQVHAKPQYRSGDARGSGPRWHPFDAYLQGFTARHLPGL